MMTSSKNKKGMTLTELLVACILIGIVMLGVASFSVSIQQFQKTTDLDTLLSMKAMTAISYLTRDAYLLTGDAVNDGIVVAETAGIASICFRHNSSGGDPGSYGDDEYACYLLVKGQELSRCVVPAPNVPPNNTAQCGGGARNILFSTRSNSIWSFTTDSDGRTESINFTIDAIFDPAKVEHPITNPVYSLTTQVSPPALSR